MTENTFIDLAEEHSLHTYNKFPIVIEKGEGVYVYDEKGNKYLDFAAGIAVNALGYSNEKFKNAVKEQIDKICHTSNLYYHTCAGAAAEALTQASKMDKVFFTNSGAEAIEGALKAARKYAYTKKSGRYEFIAMEEAFHGRTLGALSVTGHASYREPFEPLLGGVKFAKYNDFANVKEQVTEKTCAIIMEPLQGEGGVFPADKKFLEDVRKLCDENDILLIFDEIQCGMCRTGAMFAWQSYGVKPDIMTMAKAIGNGIPVGAFAMTQKVAEVSLVPGDHGTTYGGNPLACAAVKAVTQIVKEEKLLEHVAEIAVYFEAKLDALVEKYSFITARRGKGLIQGLEIEKPLSEVTVSALKKGLLVISAGINVLRFVPPLVIEKAHIDEMTTILESVFEEIK